MDRGLHTVAFERLKQAMVQSPVLQLPNFNEEFEVEGIGAATQPSHSFFQSSVLQLLNFNEKFEVECDASG